MSQPALLNAASEVLLQLERHGALQRNELGGYKFTQPGLHQPLPAVTA